MCVRAWVCIFARQNIFYKCLSAFSQSFELDGALSDRRHLKAEQGRSPHLAAKRRLWDDSDLLILDNSRSLGDSDIDVDGTWSRKSMSDSDLHRYGLSISHRFIIIIIIYLCQSVMI